MGRVAWSEFAQAALALVALGAVAYAKARNAEPAGAPQLARDVTDLIGNTPLVRLNYLSRVTGCEIWAKLELSNPGGSAKDRVALAIVKRAEELGQLRPGFPDAVFEGTSGSTGISLAMVCRARGYEAHIVVPDDTSADKVGLLVSLGAHVHKVRPAGIADQNHYVNVARRMAEETNRESGRQAVFANQFENEVNWRVHYATTGPELSAQMPRIDSFVTGAGTGGTIAGVARYLKAKNPHVRIVLADVPGSGLYNKVHYGVMYNIKEKEGSRRRHQVDTVVEGIGLNRITANFHAGVNYIDDSERVSDNDARYMASVLVEREGLFVGSSSAVNCVAALHEARRVGPGKTIVTILCDSGTRHLSKFWAVPLDEECPVSQELKAMEQKVDNVE